MDPGKIWFDIMDEFQLYVMKQDILTNVTSRELCQNDLSIMYQGTQTGALWASKMLDSWGKIGPGIFKRRPKFPGDYDECLMVVPEANYTTQYCTSSVTVKQLLGHSLPNIRYTAGLCLPSTCSGEDAKVLINEFLAALSGTELSYGSVECKLREIPWSDNSVCVLVVLCFFAFFMVTGTLFDVLIVRGYIFELTCQNGADDNDYEYIPSSNEKRTLPSPSNSKSRKYEPGWLGKFFLSFSVRTNAEKLLSTKTGKGNIDCINGIRFYSMCWVVLGHHYVFGSSKINFSEYVGMARERWTFQTITNAYPSVDTFFTLSGLLMTYLVMKELEKLKSGNLGGFLAKFYFHRFWRLTPPYMLFMLAYVTLWRYLGDGPYWPQDGMFSNECDTWYYNLLYVNNFMHDRTCMVQSWYLANDMQFFWFSPFIFLPIFYLKDKPYKPGLLWAFVLLLANILYVSITSVERGFGAISGTDWKKYIYYKPYARIGAYIVGMVTGYVMYRTKLKVRMHWSVWLFGWVAATAAGLSILYGLYGENSGK